jgi:hypothetical protein
MSSESGGQGKTGCPFCNKKGLPIFPTRYAIARTSKKPAPKIEAPFGAEVTDIVLPDKLAHYTLRTLRSGYLYAFDEKRGEWKSYVVTADGFLYEFDFDSKSPPPDTDDIEFTCTREEDSPIARCITVRDPQHATKVWLGFSDTAWTRAVRKLHKSEAYRKLHMRCIDIGKWRNESTQAHTSDFSKLEQQVGEFSYEELRPSGSQTITYYQYQKSTNIFGQTIEAEYDLKAEIPEIVIQNNHAFDFSIFDFKSTQLQGRALSEWGVNVAKPLKPLMVALNDPVGMLMELNSLMMKLTANFENKDQRALKQYASNKIVLLRELIAKKAEADASKAFQAESEAYKLGYNHRPNMAPPGAIQKNNEYYSDPKSLDGRLEAARNDSWSRYKDDYHENARLKFDKKLSAEQEIFHREVLGKLAKVFVKWYQSSFYRNAMHCNHDSSNLDSGLSYTLISTTVLDGISGNHDIANALVMELHGRYTDVFNTTRRALLLNDEQTAIDVEAVFATKLDLNKPSGWNKVFKAFAHVAKEAQKGNFQPGEGIKGELIANFIYKILGPIIRVAGGSSAPGLDSKSKQMIASMTALLGESKTLKTITLSEPMSQGELERMLVKNMMKRKGIAENDLTKVQKRDLKKVVHSRIAKELTEDAGLRKEYIDGPSKPGVKKFQWKVMMDDDVLKAAVNAETRRAINAGDLELFVNKKEFDALITLDAKPKVNISLGVGLLGAFLDAVNIYSAWSHYKGDIKSGAKLFAAACGFLSTALQTLDKVRLSNLTWGKLNYCRSFSWYSNKIITNSEFVGFLGKSIGAIAGFLGAALDLWKAIEEFKEGDIPMGILFSVTAVAGGIATWLVLVGTLTAGAGFVVLLILGALTLLGEWLIDLIRDDKIEVWLNKTPFGKGEHGWFADQEEQEFGFIALAP